MANIETGSFQSKEEEIAEMQLAGQLLKEHLRSYTRSNESNFRETLEEADTFIDDVSRLFPPDDQRQIYDALSLMFTVQIDQKDRPSGQVYVGHPLAVAHRVLKMTSRPDSEMVIAALLHDTVEDQSADLSLMLEDDSESETVKLGTAPDSLVETERALTTLRNKYGDRVADLVTHLTNPDFPTALAERGIKTSSPEFQSEKNRLYAEHVRDIVKYPDVFIIKLADFAENTLQLSELPADNPRQAARKAKLIQKYLPVIKIFIDKTKDIESLREYKEGLERVYDQFIQNS